MISHKLIHDRQRKGKMDQARQRVGGEKKQYPMVQRYAKVVKNAKNEMMS